MSAHRFATLVAFLAASCFGASREVVVYLSGDAQPTSLEAMKSEAGALLQSAGYHLAWNNLRDARGASVNASVIVLEMRGKCQPPNLAIPARDQSASLASTAMIDGKLLPFVTLECDALSRLIASALAKTGGDMDFLYGRAMGRLAAHELNHILGNTREHVSGGVAKSSFSAQDVLADRFEFAPVTLTKLRESISSSEAIDDTAQTIRR